MLTTIASDQVLDAAYAWLCERRRDWPADADVWAARDALVLKALAIVLGRHLPVSRRCVHVKDHGGAKAAVREVMLHLPENVFVLRTDVRAYYESIDQHLLLDMLGAHITDRRVLNLLWQAMRRTVTWGGLYRDCKRGISRGCPLSPLLAAVFLGALDAAMAKHGQFYVRFMDDVVVLAPTRWKLRHAVKRLNDVLTDLKLDKHPDKTFIGRIEKGFDFLGYRFDRSGLGVAAATMERFVRRMARLYEQKGDTQKRAVALETYVQRWWRWALGGLGAAPTMGNLSILPPSRYANTEKAEAE